MESTNGLLYCIRRADFMMKCLFCKLRFAPRASSILQNQFVALISQEMLAMRTDIVILEPIVQSFLLHRDLAGVVETNNGKSNS